MAMDLPQAGVHMTDPKYALGDLDALTQRLRSEAANERRDFWSPPYVGAFVRIAS
jgi:thiamine pyrophosphokinase